jgi:hypothetical protein
MNDTDQGVLMNSSKNASPNESGNYFGAMPKKKKALGADVMYVDGWSVGASRRENERILRVVPS